MICSRSDPNAAAASISKTLHQENTICLPPDLTSRSKVPSFASIWDTKNYPPIQALLLNAALQFPDGPVLTDDGMESTFAIALVGHALLFHLLFPYLADDARVIVTSSGTHDPAQKSGSPDAVYTTAEELARKHGFLNVPRTSSLYSGYTHTCQCVSQA